MTPGPPKIYMSLLRMFCPYDWADEIEGDFQEEYHRWVIQRGKAYANKKSLMFILSSTPRMIFRKRTTQYPLNRIDMLKNLLVISFRNLKRSYGYTLINIVGLAIGLSCCLLITLYVNHETSYDRFHDNASKIVRVNTTFSAQGSTEKMMITPTALLPNILKEFDEVESGTRLFDIAMFSPVVVKRGENVYEEERFVYADSTFFDVFSFKILQGNPQTVLNKPFSVMITETYAYKYFKDQNPIGEVLEVNGQDYNITGILADIPDNSHHRFDFLASFSSTRASRSEIWGSANYATYLKIKNSKNKDKIASAMNQMVIERSGEQLNQAGLTLTYELMPITDIHLRSEVARELQPQNDIQYIYMISAIGFLILIIACINYMNLATARSADRAGEVGMRKVLGAQRNELFFQFIGESFFVTLLATIIALIFASSLLPVFQNLTGLNLSLSSLAQPVYIVQFILFILLVSVLAGAYPALVLSGFNPSQALKNVSKIGMTGNILRKVLVVFQFIISAFLIVGTLVVYSQLRFMQNKKLGYDKENVLVISTDNKVNQAFESIKTSFESRGDVVSVSIASETPSAIEGGYSMHADGMLEGQTLNINALTVQRDFVKTLGMEIVAGRDLTATDETLATLEGEDRKYSFLVNEELLKRLILSSDKAIGVKANINGREGEIVGVVRDFHYSGMDRKIDALAMFIEPAQFNKLIVKVKSDNLSLTLSELEEVWKTIVPHRPMIFEFLDDQFDTLYRTEQRLGNLFTVFSTLAIFIAAIGLFGLAAFTAQKRRKEIGIRKVLGATVRNIVLMLSKDFIKLVLIAFVLAIPFSWFSMNKWLEDFVYKIDIDPIFYVISGIGVVLLAWLVISYQSFQAATRNPMETLRSE